MLIQPAVDQILTCLRQLSDAHFQTRVWVRGEGPEVSSPSELVVQLFDDTGLSDLLEAGRGPVFSTEIDTQLVDLGARLDQIDFDQDAAALVADPRWLQIQSLAADIARRIQRCR